MADSRVALILLIDADASSSAATKTALKGKHACHTVRNVSAALLVLRQATPTLVVLGTSVPERELSVLETTLAARGVPVLALNVVVGVDAPGVVEETLRVLWSRTSGATPAEAPRRAS